MKRFSDYRKLILRFVLTINPINLERVVSIESWDSPQCSTNVIGATPVGISEKGLVIESIFLHQSQ